MLTEYDLQCRLSPTIRCLSHPSAHVRALSMSVLRDILNNGHINPSKIIQGEQQRNGIQSSSYRCLAASINWQADVQRCIEWEAHSRRATGLTLAFLGAAAKELGCPLPCWQDKAIPWDWRRQPVQAVAAGSASRMLISPSGMTCWLVYTWCDLYWY